MVSLFWSVKISSHYFLSAALLVNVTVQTLSRQLECLVVYFELMGWWKLKLCNMIEKAIFLCRSINYSQHSPTLGKEEEKWTQLWKAPIPSCQEQGRKEKQVQPLLQKCVLAYLLYHNDCTSIQN